MVPGHSTGNAPSMKLAIYVVTRQGLAPAMRLREAFDVDVFAPVRMAEGFVRPYDSLGRVVAESFTRYEGHVFIAATGIAVRTIAPHILSKDTDPAIVCMDHHARHVISLLSGHLGGGNALTLRIAEAVNGHPVITTATDMEGLPSADMMAARSRLAIGNLDGVKRVNAAWLESCVVQIHDPEKRLLGLDRELMREVAPEQWQPGKPGIWVSWREDCRDESALRLYPKELVLGVGCRRGADAADILHLIQETFRDTHLSLHSLSLLASVDAKREEQGLLLAARTLGLETEFYSSDDLSAVSAPTPSSFVLDVMGTSSVCEAAAILASQGGELVVPKRKSRTATLAVARSNACFLS